MVLYSIHNLNESFSIAFSIPKIKDGIAIIPLLETKYKFISPDESSNYLTLESKEFLNSAIFIDFNLMPIQENQTDVTIKIRRKKRSFDKNYQLTNSFLQIENLIRQLKKALKLDNSQINELRKQRKIIESTH